MVDKYLKNMDYCFKVCKICGIYRPKGVHIGHRIYGFFTRLLFIDIFLVLQTIYFSRIKNIIDFADLLSMQLTWVSITSKSYITIHRFEYLVEILSELREILEFASENQVNFGKHIMKRMDSIYKVFIVFWSTCPFTIMLAFISAIMDAKEPPYMTHYKLYAPPFFDFEQNYFFFIIAEIYANIGPTFGATTAVAMDFLGVFFFSMGAGLLEELSDRIASIETELNVKITKGNQHEFKKIEAQHEAKILSELKRCIVIHGKIKKFLTSAQKMVSPIIFIQVIISTAVICMTCYTISMFSPADGASVFFRQITYMMPMGLQIFIPCYYGNEIMIAAEKFSMDILHTKWYNGCKKFQNSFKTLLIHASQPLIMVCGIIFQITLENFVTVSQLSYKFYAVMQNMNAKDAMQNMKNEEEKENL